MSSCLIYVLSVIRDWQRLAVSCMVFLIALLVSASALAQDRPCLDVINSRAEMDGQTYVVVTLNGHLAEADPKACSLYTGAWLYPIVDPTTKKKLGLYEWARTVFAANQNWHGNVVRGCVPTFDRKPPEDATDEEKALCPKGRVNYVGRPSNGWKGSIRIPSQPTLTWGEAQLAAAKVACPEAKSDAAKKACQAAGQSSTSTSPAPSASTPAPIVSEQDNARIKQLEAENADLRAKLEKAEKKGPETVQSSASAKQDASLPWAIVIFLSLSLLIVILLEERRVKQAKQANPRDKSTIPPNVATLRRQLKEADAEVDKLKAELAETKKEAKRQLDCDDAEIKQLRKKHKAELETKKQEDLAIREELARVRKTSVDASVYQQSESDNSKLRKANEGLVRDKAGLAHDVATLTSEKVGLEQQLSQAAAKATAQDTEVTRLASENVELRQQVSAAQTTVTEAEAEVARLAQDAIDLKDEINGYNRQIIDLQERLGKALEEKPPTTMPFPPTTEISHPPTTATISSSTAHADETAEDDPFRLLSLAQKVILQAISDAYHQYFPELIDRLGGEVLTLEGIGPQIVFARAINLAEKKRYGLLQAAAQVAQTEARAHAAERQVEAHMQTISVLSDEIETAHRAQRRAEKGLEIVRDMGIDPESRIATAQLDANRAQAERDEIDAQLRQVVSRNGELESENLRLQAAAFQEVVPAAGQFDLRDPHLMSSLTVLVDEHLSTPPVSKELAQDDEPRLSWTGNESSPEAPTVPRGRTVTQSFELSGAKAPSEPTIQPVEESASPEGGRPSFAKTLAPSPLMLTPDPDKPDKGSSD